MTELYRREQEIENEVSGNMLQQTAEPSTGTPPISSIPTTMPAPSLGLGQDQTGTETIPVAPPEYQNGTDGTTLSAEGTEQEGSAPETEQEGSAPEDGAEGEPVATPKAAGEELEAAAAADGAQLGEEQAPVETEPAAEPPVETEPAAEPPVETEPAAELPVETEPAAEPPVETEPAAELPVETEPAAEPPVETELAAEPPVETEPAAELPVETELAAEPPVETEPAAEPPVETEPAAEPPVETELESSTEANREATTETSTETPEASFTPQETTSRPRRLKDLEVGMELDGRVTSVALYGIFVDIGLGRDGLVHISEMSDKRIDSPSDMVNIGDSVKVFVKKVDLEDRRISLTMRQPREEPEKAPRGRFRRNEPDRDALAQLHVGDVVNGTITGLAPFGAFVDIGVGKDGLVHISELAENRVHKPEEAVQVGSQRTFKVLEVDPEGKRISLSLRRAQRIERMQQLSPGDIVEGKVSGLAPFGAFVDIGVGRDGLVHISQLSHDRVGKVEDVVKIGDPITARVLEVDTQGKRISLTLRLEEPEPEPISEEPEPAVREEKAVSPAAMEAAYPPPRRDNRREGKGKRGGRGNRGNTPSPPVLETYVAGDDTEEEFEGNATLEDLLTKFGGTNSRKDRRRRNDNDDDDIDEEDRFISRKKQREAIQRTLQRRDDEE